MHAPQWSPHPNTATNIDRRAISTRAHLGGNIYSVDRTPLPVPWKLNSQADKEIEAIKVTKAKADEDAAKVRGEETKDALEEIAVTNEFNMLAELIGVSHDQNF